MDTLPTRESLAKCVSDAIRMTFDGQLKVDDHFSVQLPTRTDGRVVTVPLIGEPMYLVTLKSNADAGVVLASAMFNCAKKLTVPSMVDDALRELANMTTGQIKNIMARDHQIGVPSALTNDTTLAGARVLVGMRLQVGDAASLLEAAIVDFQLPATVAATPELGYTVTIAEDDEVTLGFLKATLQSAGMRVVAVAAEGHKALEDIRRLRPDVICLDINMPGIDGLQVLAQVRKEMPSAIVFLVSAFATADNVREAMQLRANGIIVKPFNTVRIVAEMQRALSQRNL